MDGPLFSRVLGVGVPQGPVFAQAVYPVELVSETFGPPERGLTWYLYWSFADENGKIAAAIYCDADQLYDRAELKFISRMDSAFFEWATERLNATHNGAMPPAFLGTRHMALRVERI